MFTKNNIFNHAIIALVSTTILGSVILIGNTVNADTTSIQTNLLESNNENSVNSSKADTGIIGKEDSNNTKNITNESANGNNTNQNNKENNPEIDKTKLTEAHNRAWGKTNEHGDDYYTDVSIKRLYDADEKGFNVFFNDNATQQEVDDVIREIDDAINKLVTKESVVELQAAIDRAKKLYAKAPKNPSYNSVWMVLSGTIANGTHVINDLENQDQASVNSAIRDINNAINNVETSQTSNNQTSNNQVTDNQKPTISKETPKTLPVTGEMNTRNLTLIGISSLILAVYLTHINWNRKKIID